MKDLCNAINNCSNLEQIKALACQNLQEINRVWHGGDGPEEEIKAAQSNTHYSFFGVLLDMDRKINELTNSLKQI